MHFTPFSAFTLVVAATSVLASPVVVTTAPHALTGPASGLPVSHKPYSKRADAPTDTQVLQYALTLEHLENEFYSSFLNKFDDAAFRKAGFPDFVRGRFKQIGEHEAAHVKFLTDALGADAVKPCEYKFPVTDVTSFVGLAQVLEGVGVSAYLGAAQFIKNPALTAAGAVLTTEARHNAWIGSAVNKGYPWSGPLDTPLDLDEVYSLAAQFITKCPDSNAALPVKTFPKLTIVGRYDSNKAATLKFDGDSKELYLAVSSGLTTTFVPIVNKKAVLPVDLQGTVYAVVSKSGTDLSDDSIVAGPAILTFPFNSQAVNF